MLLALAVAAGACGEVPSDDELAAEGQEQAAKTADLIRDTEIDVGFGIKRPMRIWYGSKCAEYVWRQKSKGSSEQIKQCVRWERDDTVWESVKIYEDVGARDRNEVFQAAGSCGVSCTRYQQEENPKGYGPPVRRCVETRPSCIKAPYHGCGVAAAANVLFFYGIRKSTVDLVSEVENFGFPFSENIGTTPDGLARDLQKVLNKYADGNFTVRRKSYADIRTEVQNAIRKGTPIIVLANNGAHYVTITGYEGWWRFSVTDYYGSSRQIDDWDLATGNITGDVLGFAGGYLPYTVITIDRQPR